MSAAAQAGMFFLQPGDELFFALLNGAAGLPLGALMILPSAMQADAVDLIAVKAVLMTYDYDPARNAYHRESCNTVSDFSNLIVTGLDTLKETGHPKWKTVDLTAIPPGWQIGACVKAGLALDYTPHCTAKPEPAETGGNEEYLDLLKKRLSE